jgi:hypothetical protein
LPVLIFILNSQKYMCENNRNCFFLCDRPDSGDEATLSVDNAQRVLILGTSKDLGICKAT